jgi:hypothetical protein
MMQNMPLIGNSRPRGLQVLSLRNNSITNVIYNKSFLIGGHTTFYLQGNPYCQGSLSRDDGKTCFCAQFCIISSNKSNWKVIVISTTISGFLLGLIILALGITLHRSKKNVRKLLKSKDPSIRFNIICIKKINFLIELQNVGEHQLIIQ